MSLNESHVEDAALEWFGELGYAVGHGPQLAPGEPAAERDAFGEVVLVRRLREAIRRLNPAIPEAAHTEALHKVLRVATGSLVQTNRAFHRMLRDGVDVEYLRPDGSIKGDKARLIDFADVRANDWFVVNQFTVIEAQHNRRPDVVVFVNGLPLALIELKNAADEDATIWSAYAQLQTYKAEVPSLLHYNAALVVSDGLQARMGSLTANQEWFKVWRTIDGEGDAPKTALELEVLVRGVFDRQRFLDLLQHFIVFEEDPDTGALHKIIAGYHQFHAVNAAVEETVRASGMNDAGVVREDPGRYWAGRMHGGKPGDRRAGVVWHTQGSGKSFTMLFFAARVIRESAMQNPTLVELTDRNDLDDQLFGQFQRCHDILSASTFWRTPKKPALSMPGYRGQNHRMPFNSNNPACGSGPVPAGFVQSEKFVESHGGPTKCEIRSAKSERRPPGPFDIRNSAFDILTGPDNATTFRRDLSIAFQSPTRFLKAA